MNNTRIKYRKLLYCPICFERKYIQDILYIYITEHKKSKISKSMELNFCCSSCEKDFKLKMEGVE